MSWNKLDHWTQEYITEMVEEMYHLDLKKDFREKIAKKILKFKNEGRIRDNLFKKYKIEAFEDGKVKFIGNRAHITYEMRDQYLYDLKEKGMSLSNKHIINSIKLKKNNDNNEEGERYFDISEAPSNHIVSIIKKVLRKRNKILKNLLEKYGEEVIGEKLKFMKYN